MSRKLLAYILVLVSAWLLWDYTRHRHTEMWWLKRFMSYPGIRPEVKGMEKIAVELAFKHLQRLRKHHPEKIRPALPFEKITAIPVNAEWFGYVPAEYWQVDMENYDKDELTEIQKYRVRYIQAWTPYNQQIMDIYNKYKGNA